jgi:hypothetical protein
MINLYKIMEAKDLLKENNKLYREINKLKRQISSRENQLLINEKLIFKSCPHEWEYDVNCGQYDRIKYKCTKCNLWKRPSMYN